MLSERVGEKQSSLGAGEQGEWKVKTVTLRENSEIRTQRQKNTQK